MQSTRNEILQHLSRLVGLQLAIARLAGSMRGLHFGEVTRREDRSWGRFAIHIQTPWRIEYENRIYTGNSDLWYPAEGEENVDWKTWNFETHPNLQNRKLREMLGGYDEVTDSIVNSGNDHVVTAVDADDFGGAVIQLSSGYRIVIFPNGSVGEDWRMLFRADNLTRLVVGGGVILSTPRPRSEDDA